MDEPQFFTKASKPVWVQVLYRQLALVDIEPLQRPSLIGFWERIRRMHSARSTHLVRGACVLIFCQKFTQTEGVGVT